MHGDNTYSDLSKPSQNNERGKYLESEWSKITKALEMIVISSQIEMTHKKGRSW